jgi:8-oxo-dGTP pyrophosphatase MutT (NUDIX family)
MKDYLPYLRGMIGHAPCQAVGVTALIVDEEGAILWEKRSDNGLYCFPGGSVDYEEKVSDALRREVFEETGLKIQEAYLFSITSGPETTLRYPNGDVTNYIDFAFYCPVRKNAIPPLTPDRESSQIFFAKPGSFPPKKLYLRGMEALLRKFEAKDFDLHLD